MVLGMSFFIGTGEVHVMYPRHNTAGGFGITAERNELQWNLKIFSLLEKTLKLQSEAGVRCEK
jgi:hypothetical protein